MQFFALNGRSRLRSMTLIALLAAGVASAVWWSGDHFRNLVAEKRFHPDGGIPNMVPVSFNQEPKPSFDGGVGWINSGPIRFEELRGKIVLLDFWTYCCINCHHVLPDLAKLEAKYKDELVVIGVHSAKFDAEKDTENIRRKVAEYRIKHPVVNDADMKIWRRFSVQSWPTLVLIGPTGKVLGGVSGEGNYDTLDRVIGQVAAEHKAKGDLNLTPLHFTPEMDRPVEGPLLYPGKVLADAESNRLFIGDTGHNRIVQTDLTGGNAVAIGDGEEGFVDGPYISARFNRPQGICLDGDTLYVADTENHAIRAVDLKKKIVSTIAGTGKQGGYDIRGFSGKAKTALLNSPWDVIQLPGSKAIYIAMAGPHQIWKLDPQADRIAAYAGSGRENIMDGPPPTAQFAQPSGLATDGKNLFVADSEVSAIRVILDAAGANPEVGRIVGEGLFEFGDRDGKGSSVRLQHCLGLAYTDGKLYIADTYNNKIKVCDPASKSVKSLIGTGEAGDSDNPSKLYQPGGVSAAGGRLYIADTNNHKIRVADLASGTVTTLQLADLSGPKPAARKPSFPNATVENVAPVSVAPGKEFSIDVAIALPKGYKMSPDAPMPYLVETPDQPGVLAADYPASGQRLSPPAETFQVKVPLAKAPASGDSIPLKVSVSAFICSESSSLCRIKSFVWNVPVKFESGGQPAVTLKGDAGSPVKQ